MKKEQIFQNASSQKKLQAQKNHSATASLAIPASQKKPQAQKNHSATASSAISGKDAANRVRVSLFASPARPIVVVGLFLVATIVVSLIVLITTIPFSPAIQAMNLMPSVEHNPWTLSAFFLLVYCLGACVALVVLTLRKAHLKRLVRYVLAGFSLLGFSFVFVLCALAVAGAFLGSNFFYALCRENLFIGWPFLAVMGACFGFAMPVGEEGETGEVVRHHPRRLRFFIAMGVLAWMCLLCLWVPPLFFSGAPYDPTLSALSFFDRLVALPLLCFLVTGLVTGICLALYEHSLAQKKEGHSSVQPRVLNDLLCVVPVIVVVSVCLVGFAILSSQEAFLGFYQSMYRLPVLTYGCTGVAGAVFGVGLARMKS